MLLGMPINSNGILLNWPHKLRWRLNMIIVTGQCAMLCGTLACMLVSITSLFENSPFNIIQRVPAIRGFWDLKKKIGYAKFEYVGLF